MAAQYLLFDGIAGGARGRDRGRRGRARMRRARPARSTTAGPRAAVRASAGRARDRGWRQVGRNGPVRCTASRPWRPSRPVAAAASAADGGGDGVPLQVDRRARRRGGSGADRGALKLSGTYVRERKNRVGRKQGLATDLAERRAPQKPLGAPRARTRSRASSAPGRGRPR